jgi:ferredoxin
MGLDPTEDDLKSKVDCIKCGRCARECKSNALGIYNIFTGTTKKGKSDQD